jgi:DNA segregation ATPase FtsK/SpoIIIE-like protein
MVTDQMRANMKFRICLRVETADDSKELLKRPDASTLPPLGGRGYIQIGGGALTEVQAAWAGGEYGDDGQDAVYPAAEILEALKLAPDNAPGLMIDWLVGAAAAEAARQKVPKQFKPWPDPLPSVLPLNRPIDASYLQGSKPGAELVINPDLAKWMENSKSRPLWKGVDWSEPIPLVAHMGLVDNPYQAQQRLLAVAMASDPLGILGAAGRGKTTFIKSLILTLASSLSPAELHVYALDFGRGGLKGLRSLPHIGGIVDVNEPERVERLIRMLRNIVDERQRVLAAYDSMEDYNQQNPEAAFPAVLVAIDNASEFRETYEEYLLELVSLVRDGRAFGVYFAMSGALINDIPNKLFSVLGQRVTFTQVDPSDYSMIVGRGWARINDEPGRGLMLATVDNRAQPLEFHTGVPVGEDPEVDHFRELAESMAKAWASLVAENPKLADRRAKVVEPLAEAIDLQSVLPALGKGPASITVPLGINDLDRQATLVEFQAKGPHWLVMGPPLTGKTTTLRSLVLGLAHSYSPQQVGLVLVDPSDAARRFYSLGSGDGNTLDKLPHVLATVSTADELDKVVKRLVAEFDDNVRGRLKGHPKVFTPQDNQKRSIFVIIDHYDDAAILNRSGVGLMGLAEVGKGKNLNLVVAGTTNITRDSSDELRRRAESSRYSLILNDFETVRYMGVRGSFNIKKEMPPGRGFLVKAVGASLVQVCLPFLDLNGGADALDRMIQAIRKKYPEPAAWSYKADDLAPLEAAIGGVAEVAAEQMASVTAEQNEMLAELSSLMAMQAELTAQAVPIGEPSTFASVSVDADGGKTKGKSGDGKGKGRKG